MSHRKHNIPNIKDNPAVRLPVMYKSKQPSRIIKFNHFWFKLRLNSKSNKIIAANEWPAKFGSPNHNPVRFPDSIVTFILLVPNKKPLDKTDILLVETISIAKKVSKRSLGSLSEKEQKVSPNKIKQLVL